MKKLYSLTIIFFLCFALQAADVVTLKNQQKFEGKITKISTNSLEFKAARNCYEIPLNEIEAIAFSNAKNPILIALLDDSLTVDNCMKGRKDAKMYHNKLSNHFVLGAAFPYIMIYTAIHQPSPYKGKYTSKLSDNKNLFNDPDYLSCYQKQAKKQMLIAEGSGFIVFAGSILALLINAGYFG